MKYAFIEKHTGEFPVVVMCEVLNASQSGFYSWLFRIANPSSKMSQRQRLMRAVEDIFNSSNRRYGSPKVFEQLKALGFKVGKTTVERVMRQLNFRSKVCKKFRKTTDSNHKLPVVPNLLMQDFKAYHPGQIWVSDISYIWTKEGFLYLAVIIDLKSRKVVGWSLASRMGVELCLDALAIAVKRQKPLPGLIFHSDRGSQYASHKFRRMLKSLGMIQSMSRRANCWDNAVAESFFSLLKKELIYQIILLTRESARSEIFYWIEVFYNRKRIHSALDYKTPIAAEEAFMLSAA